MITKIWLQKNENLYVKKQQKQNKKANKLVKYVQNILDTKTKFFAI